MLCTIESNVLAKYKSMNELVYEDSCLEFFQPLPEKSSRYLNFEFNSFGTMLLGIGAGRKGRALLGKD
jgi:hypothetical protein